MDIAKVFERYEDEYLKFERVDSPVSGRPDLHAFRLLDALFPGDRDMVCCAEHDEIWLSVSPEELVAAATWEQIRDLIRCGVRYDGGTDSLAMFV